MLPDPDSDLQGFPRAQEGHEMSADPTAANTRAHTTQASQRTSCTCPCLYDGPRVVPASHAPPSTVLSTYPVHAVAGTCLEASREGRSGRTNNSERSRCDRGHPQEEDNENKGDVHGTGDQVEKPPRVEELATPLIALLQEEKQEPVTSSFFMELLTYGGALPGDSGVSLDDKPEWVDLEKIRLGQQFAQKYFFGLVFSEMISLFLLFSFSGSLQPLIFSGNSDTPFKAFKRYLSTLSRVAAWYAGDFWTEGEARRHLRAVRRLHAIYRRRLNALRGASEEETRRVTHLHSPLWTAGAAEAMRADFAGAAAACPFLDLQEGRVEWINQLEMSITQMGFVGLAATFPDRFGAGGASKEELEGFVHLWRVIGHLLGVEERFNFCSEGLEGVRQRTKFLLSTVFPNSLARVGAEWEHMTRCVLAGVNHYVEGITYEVSLMYLLETCGLDCPHVRKQLSARDQHLYRGACFLLRWVLRVPLLRAFINWILRRNIKRVQTASPEWMRRSERKTYGFENNEVPHEH